ncbi:hypothetical protein C6500_15850 [Candidatus Poribacteria bacterium]|nr:MAG: hypothetical protein C6500_15850 [Candidatus Poribacteria bacterium]
MNQELIDQIKRIVERVLQEQTPISTQITHEKRLLAIFGATLLELDEPIQQLHTCRENGWKITIILSDLATKVTNLEPIHVAFGEENVLQENALNNITTFLETYQHIVLPVFSYPMAAKLALRLVDTPCTYLVFEALSKGKQVIAASDTLHQGEVSVKTGPIFSKLENDYVNALAELGVQLVPMTQIAESVVERVSGSRAIVEKTLISATTISNLDADVRELVYASPAIITPLAREHAKKRGIELIPKS